jgi:hypothetical protein
VTPLDRLFTLPAEVVNALTMIPAIARNTKAMERHTATLYDVTAAVESVSSDTSALPGLLERMDTVAEMTSILPPMDQRMAKIEETMPALLEVQRHLAQLPETMVVLNDRMEGLNRSMGSLDQVLKRMLSAMDDLAESVDALQGAVSPVGRLASKLPGQRDK